MNIQTNVKAGPFTLPRFNHHETQATERTRGLTIKTGVKAGPNGGYGGVFRNHNQTLVQPCNASTQGS